MSISLNNKAVKVRTTNNIKQYKDKALKSDRLRTLICRIACRPKLKLNLFKYHDRKHLINKAKIAKIVDIKGDMRDYL